MNIWKGKIRAILRDKLKEIVRVGYVTENSVDEVLRVIDKELKGAKDE